MNGNNEDLSESKSSSGGGTGASHSTNRSLKKQKLHFGSSDKKSKFLKRMKKQKLNMSLSSK